MNTFVIKERLQDEFDRSHGYSKFHFGESKKDVEKELADKAYHESHLCPYCHIEISRTGICDICGYDMKEGK